MNKEMSEAFKEWCDFNLSNTWVAEAIRNQGDKDV
jgi:hypothetical protein